MARGDDVIPLVGDGYVNSTYAAYTVEQSHGFWLDLIKGEVKSGKINYNQTSRPDISNSFISKCAATEELGLPAESAPEPAAEKPEQYDRWYYLDEEFQLIPDPE